MTRFLDLTAQLATSHHDPDRWRAVAAELLRAVGETLSLAHARVLTFAGTEATEQDFLVWSASDRAVFAPDATRCLSRPILTAGRLWGRVEFTDPRPDRPWTAEDAAAAEALVRLIAACLTASQAITGLSLLDSLPIAVILLDADGLIAHATPAAAALTGRTVADLVGRPVATILGLPPEDGPGVVHLAEGGQAPVLVRNGSQTLEGGRILMLAPPPEAAPGIPDLARLAFEDAATGLPTRNLLLHGAISGNTVIAIRLLDRLDAVPDLEDGPSLPMAIADELRRVLGTRRALLARVSESGFAVVIDADTDAALALARAIRAPFKGPVAVGERRLPVRISLGIAQGDRPTIHLLHDAEFACHPDRAGAIHRFETALRSRITERRQLEADLRRALREQDPGLGISFQPTVALADGLVVGFEVLARWQHPTRGSISPAVFIPLAEATGLMIALGSRVLDLAARTVQSWNTQRQTRNRPPVFVSANLSAHQFVDPELLTTLAAIVATSGVAPGHLRLELTETTLMARPTQTAATLAAITRLGIGLSIDDFGHGPSSLGHLHRFGVDALKIDRQFVAGITRSAREKAVVAAMISMARQLGLEPVAEGIETREVADSLIAMGCTLGQGFLFGRPMTPESAEAVVLSAD